MDEARLRALEDKLARADLLVRELEAAATALQNGIFGASQITIGDKIIPPPPPPTLYPVTSGVLGCGAFQNGISVSILASDGNTYGPVLTASGGAWTLHVPAGPATITVDPSTGTTYQQRFTGGTQSYTVPAASSSPPSFVLGIASGYACFSPCPTPVKTTLNGSSAACGAFTLTWDSISTDWLGTMSQNIPAGGSCGAASGVTVHLRLANSGGASGDLVTTMSSNPSTLCPQGGGTAIANTANWGAGSGACGPFSKTFTRANGANAPWCTGWNTGDTLTLTE